jgi:DNA-binding beta-propeller fold protein YncE
MKPPGLRRHAGLILGAFALAGCASAAPKQVGELVWPLPPEQPRIKYLESYSRRGHFGTAGTDRLMEVLLGEDPRARERMVKPYAVTTDAKGRIYVTDTGIGVVWVFDAEKKEVRFLGDSGQVRLATPAGVAVDARGVVFVADAKLDKVFGLDESGKLVLAIGTPGEFYSPSGLAIDRASGRLYVADAGRHKIRVYDSADGKFLFEFGERGTEPGKFNYPTHLFLKSGRLYVSDTMNFRVQIFDLDGRLVGKLGEMGANLGQFARPKGVGVDSEGNAYVVDAAFNNFQIFNSGGELLLFVGRVGGQPGEFWLPAGLAIDERDRILVVDQYNRRLQVFQYLGERSHMTVKQDAAKK